MKFPATCILLALSAQLGACSARLDEREVRAFIDQADDAARQRFAPAICKLRGEKFELHQKFQAADLRLPPSELELNRKMFCVEAGKFSRIRQYLLERKSLDVDLAADRKTARVTAQYSETLPYYEPEVMPATPDDFLEFQILETRDESIIGVEGGDVVFLSTGAEVSQTLVPKSSLKIPYN
jgi:hypothetical protein